MSAPEPRDQREVAVPVSAYVAGGLAFLAAILFAQQARGGGNIEAAGCFIAAGLCVLGGCVAIGLAALTAALLRR